MQSLSEHLGLIAAEETVAEREVSLACAAVLGELPDIRGLQRARELYESDALRVPELKIALEVPVAALFGVHIVLYVAAFLEDSGGRFGRLVA